MTSARYFILLVATLGIRICALVVGPASLRCNGFVNPIGLDPSSIRLSWSLTSSASARDDNQSAFHIQASSDASFQKIDLWNTGNVESDNSSALYEGRSLAARARVFWRVRVLDVAGASSAWSDTAWFELSLAETDWKAKWITNDQYRNGSNALPIFAKEFTVPCNPSRARLYYIGLGSQWAAINGKSVTEEVLLPSYSTMNKTLFFSSYDVTDLVDRGDNVLVVELGKGVYTAEPGLHGRYSKFTAVGAPLDLKLLAQLEIVCTNGQALMFISDESWLTTTEGPMLEASWYGGEEYDARREMTTAYLVGGSRNLWTAATLTAPPFFELHPRFQSPNLPPLNIVEEFPCVEITRANMSWIFDFGQNLAGWYRFNFSGEPGQRIEFWPSERLFTNNGSADQSTTGHPIFNGYTFASHEREQHTLKFNYHGFRYLEVFGLQQKPDPQDIVALRIRADVPKVGVTETNVALFNNIHRIIDQAIQSQMYSVVTDCPHREKLGWLEQLHLAIDPVFFGYDFRGYGRHLMRLMSDAQNQEGNVPTTAPQLVVFGPYPPYNYDYAPNWGISIVLFAWAHYTTYGDIEILSDNYEAMQNYVDYLTSQNQSYILTDGLGDWEAVDGTTAFGLVETAGFAQAVKTLIAISNVLGHPLDAKKYEALHRDILISWDKTYRNQTGYTITYGTGTQAADALALDIGAVQPSDQEAVYRHLISSIRDNDTHWTVGEIALPALFRIFTLPNGYDYLLIELMTKTDYPSYGFMLEQGATTLTEHWDGYAGTGSLNHFMFGYGDTWIYGLAGMRQSEGSVGWRRIEFEAVCVENVTFAEMEYLSVRGRAAARWAREEVMFVYNVTVPVGSSGLVKIQAPEESVRLDGEMVKGQLGVRRVEQVGSKTMVHIGSGTYVFSVPRKDMYFCGK